MNRRRYELYGLTEDPDLRLRKVPLGYSDELVGSALRPDADACVEVLPAGKKLREWVINNHLARESEDIRFIVTDGLDPFRDPFNPLASPELLSRLAYLGFSDNDKVAAWFRQYGESGLGLHQAHWERRPRQYPSDLAIYGNEVDFKQQDRQERPTGKPWDEWHFEEAWVLEREAAILRAALELARAVRDGNPEVARALIGPVARLEDLPYRGTRVGPALYSWHGPCWYNLGDSGFRSPEEAQEQDESIYGPDDELITDEPALRCEAKENCPRPDDRSGWYLDHRISGCTVKGFGPCGSRRAVTDEEYRVAAHHLVADWLTYTPHIQRQRVKVSPLTDAGLAAPLKAEFKSDIFVALGRFPGAGYWTEDRSLDDIVPECQPGFMQLFQHARPRTGPPDVAREPLYTFNRVLVGSGRAAWYQLLDLLVHHSELRRCKHCGALFGVTHGNQQYCSPPAPGQPSPCQQAAKQARKRAARKARPKKRK